VNVRTDAVLRKDVEQFEYEKTEPLKMQESEERERKSVQDSGEAGVRPNTGLSIAGARPAGDTETYNRTRSEFSPKSITSRAQIREVGQGTKQVNVTVNVPRSYFVGLLRQSAGAGTGDAGATTPGSEQIEAAAAKELANIVKQVEPLVNAEAEGVVRAHMIPDIDVLLAMMGKGGEQKAGMGSMFSSPTAHTIGLATLALVSIGLMFGMVRKALHQPVLPTVEELAGVPPNLPGEDDLIGEVEESDAPMSGVEVDDNEVRARKIAEQISEMIKANPTEAVGLFKRWVDNED
jgi:flagellar biosynthesis/type III secretory pathway M-ring protein FliF/YscJ